MLDRSRFSLFTKRIGHITPSNVVAHSPRAPIAASATALVLAALVAGCGGGQPSGSSPSFAKSQAGPTPRPVTAGELAQLPQATTYSNLRGAATDSQPFAAGSGLVVHPRDPWVVYASPGGPPVAVLPATEMGSPTWVPVVQTQPGWDMVLLPSRPNRSIGWVATGNGATLETAHTSYVVRVNTTTRQLTLVKDGTSVGTWPVGVGTPGTPTPTGRTFILASLTPAHPTYSWLILPTGAHSNSLETFGGGPGTVGLHTWPDSSVFGHAVSHGCVRIPDAGLKMLSHVPLGSLVLITS